WNSQNDTWRPTSSGFTNSALPRAPEAEYQATPPQARRQRRTGENRVDDQDARSKGNRVKLQDRSLELELTLDEAYDDASIRRAAARRLQLAVTALPPLVMWKRSLDCRGRRIRYHVLVEALFSQTSRGDEEVALGSARGADLAAPEPREVNGPSRVVI